MQIKFVQFSHARLDTLRQQTADDSVLMQLSKVIVVAGRQKTSTTLLAIP